MSRPFLLVAILINITGMTTKVYIIGSGAIGKSLAVFLKAQGRNVTLIKATEDDGKEQMVPIEVSMNDGSVMKHSVLLSSFSRQKQFDGVIVLANKAFGNTRIAEQLANKAGQSPIVVMQNGLNVEETLVRKGLKNIFRCVLFSTSQSIDDTVIRFKPVSPSPIGIVSGDDAFLPDIIEMLDTPHFPFEAVANIQPIIWKKVIANCVFNSICPLTETDNGIFHRDENARSMAKDVIKECVDVANLVGIPLDVQEVIETVLRISKSSDGQLISTLQDIRHNRPTEIDSLNFAVANLASKHSASHLVTRTLLLGQLTKLKSDSKLQQLKT